MRFWYQLCYVPNPSTISCGIKLVCKLITQMKWGQKVSNKYEIIWNELVNWTMNFDKVIAQLGHSKGISLVYKQTKQCSTERWKTLSGIFPDTTNMTEMKRIIGDKYSLASSIILQPASLFQISEFSGIFVKTLNSSVVHERDLSRCVGDHRKKCSSLTYSPNRAVSGTFKWFIWVLDLKPDFPLKKFFLLNSSSFCLRRGVLKVTSKWLTF